MNIISSEPVDRRASMFDASLIPRPPCVEPRRKSCFTHRDDYYDRQVHIIYSTVLYRIRNEFKEDAGTKSYYAL